MIWSLKIRTLSIWSNEFEEICGKEKSHTHTPTTPHTHTHTCPYIYMPVFSLGTVIFAVVYLIAGEGEEALDDEDTPQLDTIMIQHEGVINRLRVSGERCSPELHVTSTPLLCSLSP